MVFKRVPPPKSKWISIVKSWLAESKELLILFTFANAGGANGYTFCRSLSEIKELISEVSLATRVTIYKKFTPFIKGIVDESFISRAKLCFPIEGDFLLIRLEEVEEAFRYDGYTGRNIEELEEYLRDCMNEHVLICTDPEDECNSDERIVIYKGGLRGAY
jgi:hypothetical protein